MASCLSQQRDVQSVCGNEKIGKSSVRHFPQREIDPKIWPNDCFILVSMKENHHLDKNTEININISLEYLTVYSLKRFSGLDRTNIT